LANYPVNQKNSSMLCIGVKKVKIHFDTSQLCCGVVHYQGGKQLKSYLREISCH